MRMELHAHGPPLLSAVSHTDTATTGMAKTQQHDLMTHSGIETPLPVGAMAARLARVQAFVEPGVDVDGRSPHMSHRPLQPCMPILPLPATA